MAKSVSETHTSYLKVLIHLPTYEPSRGWRREGKGRDNKRGKELFFSIEKCRCLSGYLKTEWHGTSLWAGFFFSFFSFSFSLTNMHLSITLHTHLPLSLSLSLSREIIAHVWTAGPMETSLVARRVKSRLCALTVYRESQDDDEQGRYQRLDWTW